MARKRGSISILSPLRYPGSKRRLAYYIHQILKLNQLTPSLFIEPFAGGASISLQLLNDGFVERIGLIERDPLVANFWKTVFWDADWLVEKIQETEATLDLWQKLKNEPGTSRREQAFACLILNRTSFSGILAPGAGPIGGYTQESEYAIDCRFPHETLVRRVRQAEQLAPKVAFVWNLSWKRGLNLIASMQKRGTLPNDAFFYMDPPFFEKADRLYTFYFSNRDHLDLRDALLSLTDPWVLSYDSIADVQLLYENTNFDQSQIETLYSVGRKQNNRSITEVIVSNIEIPGPIHRIWGHHRTDLENGKNMWDLVAAGGDD